MLGRILSNKLGMKIFLKFSSVQQKFIFSGDAEFDKKWSKSKVKISIFYQEQDKRNLLSKFAESIHDSVPVRADIFGCGYEYPPGNQTYAKSSEIVDLFLRVKDVQINFDLIINFIFISINAGFFGKIGSDTYDYLKKLINKYRGKLLLNLSSDKNQNSYVIKTNNIRTKNLSSDLETLAEKIESIDKKYKDRTFIFDFDKNSETWVIIAEDETENIKTN